MRHPPNTKQFDSQDDVVSRVELPSYRLEKDLKSSPLRECLGALRSSAQSSTRVFDTFTTFFTIGKRRLRRSGEVGYEAAT